MTYIASTAKPIVACFCPVVKTEHRKTEIGVNVSSAGVTSVPMTHICCRRFVTAGGSRAALTRAVGFGAHCTLGAVRASIRTILGN